MAWDSGPHRRVRPPWGSIDLLEGATERHTSLDMLEDRVANLVRKPAGRAQVRCRHIRHFHPHATDVECVGAERGGDAEDLSVTLSGDCSSLGQAAADGLDLDGDVNGRMGLGVGDVLGGGPHGGSACGLLEGDQRCPEPTSPEEELPRGDQVGADVETPAQIIAGAGEAEELAYIHDSGPYRSDPQQGHVGQPLVILAAMSLLSASGAGPENAMWVPSAPNHSGCSVARAFQSASTAFFEAATPAARTALFGSCQGWPTCTLTNTTREAPARVVIIESNMAAVIGPLVESPTTTTDPSVPAAF